MFQYDIVYYMFQYNVRLKLRGVETGKENSFINEKKQRKPVNIILSHQ